MGWWVGDGRGGESSGRVGGGLSRRTGGGGRGGRVHGEMDGCARPRKLVCVRVCMYVYAVGGGLLMSFR